MEKYAVVYEEESVKTASKKERFCPKCGVECIQNDQLLMWCPVCGTEPWEKKPATKEK